ncbi:MAG: hypothetical protein FWH10_04270 [Oscillospiraceae bacterium]|nr:hypothetical protein [Oscillospiraceae bacterium]
MSNVQVRPNESGTNRYPLGQVRNLSAVESKFWREESILQNAQMQDIEEKNDGLNLDVSKQYGNFKIPNLSTRYNTKDVDLLTRFSDAGKTVPSNISNNLMELGDLRAKNKFLGIYLDNFDEMSNDLDIRFRNDNHKEMVKQALIEFYEKREETINLTKEKISKDIDALNIPAFDAKGRDLNIVDTYDERRIKFIKNESLEPSESPISVDEEIRNAVKRAEANSIEVFENKVVIDSIKKELSELKEEHLKKQQEFMQEQWELTEAGRLEEAKALADKNALEQEALGRDIKAKGDKMNELQDKIDNIHIEQLLLSDEVAIMTDKKEFDKNNQNSREISFDDLSREDRQPQQSRLRTFFDSVGKTLSSAWANLMSHFKPLEPTAEPEQPKPIIEIGSPDLQKRRDELQKQMLTAGDYDFGRSHEEYFPADNMRRMFSDPNAGSKQGQPLDGTEINDYLNKIAGMNSFGANTRDVNMAKAFMLSKGYTIDQIETPGAIDPGEKKMAGLELIDILQRGDTTEIAKTWSDMAKAMMNVKIPEGDFTKDADIAKNMNFLKFMRAVYIDLDQSLPTVNDDFKKEFDAEFKKNLGPKGAEAWGKMGGVCTAIGGVFLKGQYLMMSDDYSSTPENKNLRGGVFDYNRMDGGEASIYEGTEFGKYINMAKGLTLGQVDMVNVKIGMHIQSALRGGEAVDPIREAPPVQKARIIDYAAGNISEPPFKVSNTTVDLANMGAKGIVNLTDYKANVKISKEPPVKQKEEPAVVRR